MLFSLVDNPFPPLSRLSTKKEPFFAASLNNAAYLTQIKKSTNRETELSVYAACTLDKGMSIV